MKTPVKMIDLKCAGCGITFQKKLTDYKRQSVWGKKDFYHTSICKVVNSKFNFRIK